MKLLLSSIKVPKLFSSRLCEHVKNIELENSPSLMLITLTLTTASKIYGQTFICRVSSQLWGELLSSQTILQSTQLILIVYFISLEDRDDNNLVFGVQYRSVFNVQRPAPALSPRLTRSPMLV